ncbi:MAG: hypothetical protein ACOZNI_11010 [Myxococcota bacterium]
MIALLLACATPTPPAVAGPSRRELPAAPALPCPFEVEGRWAVGGVPVPGPPALAPAEDHLTIAGEPVFSEGRLAAVAEDDGEVWLAGTAGLARVGGGAWATRSPAVAVDARGGVAWAVTVDGEVLRVGPDGEAARSEVDGRPVAVVAAGEGAWVLGVDDVWRPVGAPSPREEAVVPATPVPDPMVALEDGVVATRSGVRGLEGWRVDLPDVVGLLPEGDGWRVVTARDGEWVVGEGRMEQVIAPGGRELIAATPGVRLTADGELLPARSARPGEGRAWHPPRALAVVDGWVAVGFGLVGRLELLGPAGERRVHALPGPLELVGAPLPGSELRWDGDALWIPMPAHGLARMEGPTGSPATLPGVPGAWDVAPWEGGHVVALGDLGVGVLAGDVLVGRCAHPGRVIRVATGPGGVWAASSGVVTRLRKRGASEAGASPG